jgi:glutathione S-transferase
MQNKLTVEMIAKMDKELAEWLPLLVKAHIEGHTATDKPVPLSLWPHFWIHKGFDAIENLIADDGFCFGNDLTLADCALVPQTIGAIKYQLDMSPYPKIMRVYNKVLDLECVKQTMADAIAQI